jgi:hypothetical protein
MAQAQRPRIGDEESQYSSSSWTRSNLFFLLWLEPNRDELSQRRAVVVEHTECAVASSGDGPSLLDDVAQQSRQLKICLDQQGRFKYPSKLGRIIDRPKWHN